MFVNLTKSTRQGKKMMAIFYDADRKKVKTTYFGSSGYEHYSGGHGDIQHKMNYISRYKDKED
jgi:hypothetical protein